MAGTDGGAFEASRLVVMQRKHLATWLVHFWPDHQWHSVTLVVS